MTFAAFEVLYSADAVTFVRLEDANGVSHFGVGFGSNIDQAAVRAVVSGLNGILLQGAGAGPSDAACSTT